MGDTQEPITPTYDVVPLVAFIATMPDKFGRGSHCLDVISKISNLVMLHPCYDFSSGTGKKTLDIIGGDVPEYTNTWESVMRKDFFCISKSDVVVADLDSIDSYHLLAVAACYNKCIIAVSSTLLSIPAYYSGSVLCVVKPEQLPNIIELYRYDESFKKLPMEKEKLPESRIK